MNCQRPQDNLQALIHRGGQVNKDQLRHGDGTKNIKTVEYKLETLTHNTGRNKQFEHKLQIITQEISKK